MQDDAGRWSITTPGTHESSRFPWLWPTSGVSAPRAEGTTKISRTRVHKRRLISSLTRCLTADGQTDPTIRCPVIEQPLTLEEEHAVRHHGGLGEAIEFPVEMGVDEGAIKTIQKACSISRFDGSRLAAKDLKRAWGNIPEPLWGSRGIVGRHITVSRADF